MRSVLSILAVALVIGLPTASAQVTNPANGHVYLLTTPGQNILTARAAAVALGGYLVAINDSAEDAFIQANFQSDYWIGLSDLTTEGTYVWDSGEPFSYSNWCPNEPSQTAPNHDFVYMDSTCPGQWNDINATGVSLPGLVELPFTTPLFQVNSTDAAMDLDGVATNGYAAATATKCTGYSTNINFSGALAGSPWDMGFHFIGLVAAVTGAGTVTAGGQVVNLDLGQPLSFLNGTTGPNLTTSTFSAFTLTFAPAAALTVSGQALVVSPAQMDGFVLTQANQLDIIVGAPTTQILALGDDTSANVQTGPPLCGFGGVTFYGTIYTDFNVCSNGFVSFAAVSTDFTPTTAEFTSEMPRVAGMWTDLTPNISSTIQVVPNVNDITVQFINVPEFGAPGNLNSFDIIFDDAGGTTIDNYMPAPGHATGSLTGISNGGAGTPGLPISFAALAGLGFQVTAAATDAVYEYNPGGPVAIGWTTAYFPQSDSSVYTIN